MSFGLLGRHWSQRACFAGTYDANWQENVFPFLPADFDERHFQGVQQAHPLRADTLLLEPDMQRILPCFCIFPAFFAA